MQVILMGYNTTSLYCTMCGIVCLLIAIKLFVAYRTMRNDACDEEDE